MYIMHLFLELCTDHKMHDVFNELLYDEHLNISSREVFAQLMLYFKCLRFILYVTKLRISLLRNVTSKSLYLL